MGNSHGGLTGNNSISTSCSATLKADMPLWALTVLEYSAFTERGQVAQLSKYWNQNTATSQYFRFLCQRLAAENGIYIPLAPPPNESWKSLFHELYKLKNLWRLNVSLSHRVSYEDLQLTATNELKERFQISVFAKFRPLEDRSNKSFLEKSSAYEIKENKMGKSALATKAPSTVSSSTSPSTTESEKSKEADRFADTQDENQSCDEITLPLHQRLAMIRMSHRLKDNRVALKVLTEGGEWFRDKWNAISNSQLNSSNGSHGLKKSFTAAFDDRERLPIFKGTVQTQSPDVQNNKMISKVQSIDSLNGRVIMLTPDSGLREFSFNGVLPPNCSQKYTYELCMKRLVMDMLNGFNATAVVYGQTGSGKTYSMFGRDERSVYGQDREGKGIVPRACEEILLAIQRRKEINQIESELAVSYVEIYGDQITDLLKNGARCSHSKVSAQRFVLNGAAEKTVQSMEEISELLFKGEQMKRRASTAMNDRSTRAHSLFILTLKQKSFKNSNVTIQSKLFLADLGGSEQVKKSQVEAGVTREGIEGSQFSIGFELGVHMREAVYINLGLLALKRCIEALNNRSKYVPFQDSKLTMLLSEGLGGNSKTSIIVCANQHPVHSHETIMTLRFGERCALIETSLRNNATIMQQILDNIENEIKGLENEILRKERWETKEEKVFDELAEEGTIEKALGGQEIKRVAMVVGAEEERKRLVQLLMQKEQLFGKSFDTDNDNSSQENLLLNGKGRKQVLGFGKQYAELYDFGAKFDEKLEETVDNSRFEGKVNSEDLPTVLQVSKKGKKVAWAAGETLEESQEVLEKKALRVKRNKLAYSGLSV